MHDSFKEIGGTSLDNGMSLMNLDSAYQYIIKGLILLLAVWADVAMRRRSGLLS